jgi:DNA-binding transcriptional ArsR family regulator
MTTAAPRHKAPIAQLGGGFQDVDDVLARLFAALADPTRMRLVRALIEQGELSSAECQRITGLSQGRTSVHLSSLVEVGIVVAERAGRCRRYRLKDPEVSLLVETANQIAVRHFSQIVASLLGRS